MGAARIDEFVTLNRLNYEYDGTVLTSGIASIFALNKFNFGLNLGFDHLLDKNRKLWVNENKSWIGISLGLNVN